jgi:hypothetical protein
MLSGIFYFLFGTLPDWLGQDIATTPG